MATQGLFDALSGAAGHPIDRPGMNAYVANSQAINGLRSAQTEEALLNAQRAREEQDAGGQLEQALGSVFGPGNESKAHAAATIMRGHFGDAKTAMTALNELQQNQFHQTLGDPNQMGQASQTAAMQGVEGKLAPVQQIHPEYAVAPGAPAPNVQQSPLGASETAEHNAQAGLHNAQAAHPQLFHPGGQPATPDEIAAAADYIRKNPNAAPTGRALTTPTGIALVRALNGPGPAPPPNADGSPGADPTAGVSFKEQADIRHDFASGVAAKQVTSLNTLSQHAALLDAVANQLDNGDFTPGNKVKNLWMKIFGSPAPTNLHTVTGFLGREAVRATVNSGAGTGNERELAIGDDASPSQMHDAGSTIRQLARGQLNSLHIRAVRGGVDFNSLLAPEARDAYGTGTTSITAPVGPQSPAPPSGPPSAGGGPAKISNDAEYNALPSGSLFIGPDGQTRKKP
jgi:hypothetical protein